MSEDTCVARESRGEVPGEELGNPGSLAVSVLNPLRSLGHGHGKVFLFGERAIDLRSSGAVRGRR
jgi:hypothetical protein